MSKHKKVVFFHDHIFTSDTDGEVYSSGGLPASAWERYLKCFDSVTVVGRLSAKAAGADVRKKLVLSSRPSVSFEFCESASSLTALVSGGGSAKDIVREMVSSHDFVIARLASELGLLAVKEAVRQCKPYAIELVDCPWDSYWNYGNIKAKLYAPIIYYRVKRAVYNSPYTLYVTKDFLQERYPCDGGVTVACSNVELPDPPDGLLGRRINRISKTDENQPIVIGQIASLHGRFKGIQDSMRAINLLRRKLPNVQFRVLGGGDPEPWISEARKLGVEDICFFDGTLPSGEPVFSWLDRLDLYIHPSYKEGLPRALIEAMSRGCPCVATEVAGIPELLDDEFLVKPGDSIDLSNKMYIALSSKSSLTSMARDNFETSKSYSRDFLESKRKSFWTKFASNE